VEPALDLACKATMRLSAQIVEVDLIDEAAHPAVQFPPGGG